MYCTNFHQDRTRGIRHLHLDDAFRSAKHNVETRLSIQENFGPSNRFLLICSHLRVPEKCVSFCHKPHTDIKPKNKRDTLWPYLFHRILSTKSSWLPACCRTCFDLVTEEAANTIFSRNSHSDAFTDTRKFSIQHLKSRKFCDNNYMFAGHS